jgi:FkbM family methyltransferase
VRRNARSNGFSWVEVIEAAVAATAGEAVLHLGAVTGASSLKTGEGRPGIKVPVVAIDEWRRSSGARPPDVVMIDAEGAEIDVLRGMRETIGRHRPVILCEVHWIGDAFLAYCAEGLAPLGYHARPLYGETFPTGPQRFHALLTPEASAPSSG